MRRRILLLSILLGCLILPAYCVDLLLREPQEPPIVASVPPYGPWAGGPPVFWGKTDVTLINRSSEPAFVEAFSIAGSSNLDQVGE